MLIIIQRFGKRCISHVQGEYVMDARVLNPYTDPAVGGEWI